MENSHLNATGANVILSLEDGMIAFHCSRVIKFTTLLDFAQAEGFSDYLDPWGHVTLVLPHLKLESAQALGRLLYCGDTGRVPKHILDDIKSIIRLSTIQICHLGSLKKVI